MGKWPNDSLNLSVLYCMCWEYYRKKVWDIQDDLSITNLLTAAADTILNFNGSADKLSDPEYSWAIM